MTSINFLNGRRPQFFCMQDDFIFFVNGIHPQLICEWKTTSNFCKCKTNSLFFVNGKKTSIYEDSFKFLKVQGTNLKAQANLEL